MPNTKVILRYLRGHFALSREESEAETYAEIMEGARFKGHNLWIMGFAMILACVGLNIDSTSAVIGAMLISPLMGPIVAFSFGMAVNNRDFKTIGIQNWLRMTVISLIASALFFLISPFENNTLALISFKKASIFDILIAFFGGMAGFIGIMKKEGVKVLAGVSVATACMPPLCTAGYGIAHGDYNYFIGGLYFYLINCLFIGLASFVVARLAGFHKNCHLEEPRQTVVWLWNIFIILMIVPSLIIAYYKWQDAQQQQQTQKTDSSEMRIERLEQQVRQLDSLLKAKELQ
jgi:uncharacterized hydrophobic protein (TIGR00271 family)